MDADPAIQTPIGTNHDYWDFLTNHGAVLLHVVEHPDDTVVEIASLLGLRERAVAAIISDLRRLGYVEIERRGRHNHYTVNGDMPLRRPAHAHLSIKDLLSGLKANDGDARATDTASAESQKRHSFAGDQDGPRLSR